MAYILVLVKQSMFLLNAKQIIQDIQDMYSALFESESINYKLNFNRINTRKY